MQMVAYPRTGMLSQGTPFWFMVALFRGALNSRKSSHCWRLRPNMWQLHMPPKKPSGFVPSSPKSSTSPSTPPPFFQTKNLPSNSWRTINTMHAPSISTFHLLHCWRRLNSACLLPYRRDAHWWTYQGHSIHESKAFCFPIWTLASLRGSVGLARLSTTPNTTKHCHTAWTPHRHGPTYCLQYYMYLCPTFLY